MTKQRVRQWAKRMFYDPERVLRDLRALELRLLDKNVPARVLRLRTGPLKTERESRDAALFTYGMSLVCGRQFLFSPGESEDAGFITACAVDDTLVYTPVQLKELVPADLNPRATLQDLIAGLSLKPMTDTVLAMRLNRRERVEFSELDHSTLRFSEVWYFGSADPDASRWFIYGNALSSPRFHEFLYPS